MQDLGYELPRISILGSTVNKGLLVCLLVLRGRGGEDSQEGGPGSDDIFGNGGADVITPADQRDTVEAGPGDDTVQPRDRQRNVVFCDTGDDYVFVDDQDAVDDDCENVFP